MLCSLYTMGPGITSYDPKQLISQRCLSQLINYVWVSNIPVPFGGYSYLPKFCPWKLKEFSIRLPISLTALHARPSFTHAVLWNSLLAALSLLRSPAPFLPLQNTCSSQSHCFLEGVVTVFFSFHMCLFCYLTFCPHLPFL